MINFPKNCKTYNFSSNNNVFRWFDSDTEERYENNLNLFPELMKKWRNTEILYTLNAFGFRLKYPFDDLPVKTKPRLLALGCSHTFGTGLPQNSIWCNILSSILPNYEIFNLGMPGGSLDSVYRILLSWAHTLEPDIIVVQTPSRERREFFLDNNYVITVGAWREKFVRFSWDHWGDNYNIFYEEKNKNVIDYITPKIPKFYFDIEKFRCDDYARDLMHFGEITHRNFAEHVSKEIE